jgi:hypothetical protein
MWKLIFIEPVRRGESDGVNGNVGTTFISDELLAAIYTGDPVAEAALAQMVRAEIDRLGLVPA